MKKSSFVAMILGTVSGILFALGMCMTLISEWDAFLQGIILGCIGILLGLITLIVLEKNGTQSAHSYIRQTGIDYCCWYNQSIILWCWHVLWHGVGKYDCRNHHWYCRYTTASFSYSSDKRYQRVNIQQKLTGQLTKQRLEKGLSANNAIVWCYLLLLVFHFTFCMLSIMACWE